MKVACLFFLSGKFLEIDGLPSRLVASKRSEDGSEHGRYSSPSPCGLRRGSLRALRLRRLVTPMGLEPMAL